MIETALGFSYLSTFITQPSFHGVHSLWSTSFILSTVYCALKHAVGEGGKQSLSSNHCLYLPVSHTLCSLCYISKLANEYDISLPRCLANDARCGTKPSLILEQISIHVPLLHNTLHSIRHSNKRHTLRHRHVHYIETPKSRHLDQLRTTLKHARHNCRVNLR